MSGAVVEEVGDRFVVVCHQHALTRIVETGPHAANLQALHNRVDHADDTDSIEVDLTAAARALLEQSDYPGQGTAEEGALDVWRALTGIPDPAEALAHALQIAAAPEPLVAAVAPF